MRTLFLGLLLVLGTHAVAKRASRMSPDSLRRSARTVAELASIFSPRAGRYLRNAWMMSDFFQEATRQYAPPPSGQMDLAEACRILGVSPDASRESINAAYRELMRRHHPDQGGSEKEASRINAARDLLLGNLA